MLTCSLVLRSSVLGCAGRILAHASRACPSSGSTGVVNAVPVLCTGTSSRQTASSASTSRASPGTGYPSFCQRTQPTRSRETSSLRRPLNSHQGDSPDQLDRVVGACGGAGQIGRLEVQPGPEQLRPDVVGDQPRVGADQRG